MQPTILPLKPLSSSSSNSSKEKRDWISMINESVHTNDDVDIGDVYAVNRNFVVAMRRLKNIHYYYIPTRNYIKDYTYYTDLSNNYFLLLVIPPRYVIPAKHPTQSQANTKSLLDRE